MTVDSATREWIKKKFGKLDNETLDRLVSVRDIFNCSNDELYVQWEAFAVTQDEGDMDLTASNVDRFQQYLQKSLQSTLGRRNPIAKKPADGKRKPTLKTAMEFSSSPAPGTPATKRQRLPPSSDAPVASSPTSTGIATSDVADVDAPPLSPTKSASTPTETLSNAVAECLNPEIPPVDSAGHPVQLAANFDGEKFNFRTMSMKLLESADVLDDQIDTASQQLAEIMKDSSLDLGNPCMNSQFDIACCGRVVPDSPSYDSLAVHTLNDKSLYLETSRLGGIGQRIPLDLSHLQEYALFPGQVVALRGRNPTGSTFVVHEVLRLPDLGMPVSSENELLRYRESQNGGGIKVAIAAGPFHSQHSLSFSKLNDFVDHINSVVKPNVLVLFGPLLDITNRAIASADIDIPGIPKNQQPRNLTEVFVHLVTPVLKKIDSSILVILLPSLRDAVSKHASFPQCALDRKTLGLPKNFKCFPNPACFSVNEIAFGASNADVFKDLKDVVKTAPNNGTVVVNRFERIADHVFLQRRFYPLFPGSLRRSGLSGGDHSRLVALYDGSIAEDLADTDIGGASLEVPYMGLAEIGDSLPDVLVVPSELKYFAKVIRGVTVINPGQFIRGHNDPKKEEGSYVVMHVQPPLPSESGNVEPVPNLQDAYYHNVYKRARVEIYKS